MIRPVRIENIVDAVSGDGAFEFAAVTEVDGDFGNGPKRFPDGG